MKTPRQVLILAVTTVLAFSGCSTTHVRSSHAPNFADARGPAADEPLIEKFVDALSSHSGAGSQQSVEEAVTQVVNDNASKLSLSQINSLDDIAAMSEADQSRIVSELANLPELSEKLSLDSDAMNVARGEAMAAQDVKSVSTDAVADIQKGSSDGLPGFAKLIESEPELKGTVALMMKENADIQQKTGVAVLTKGCDSLTNVDSVENLANVMAGVDRDAVSGQASDTPTVAKSLENNMEYVLGEDKQEADQSICVLSDANQCGVFSPKMCN